LTHKRLVHIILEGDIYRVMYETPLISNVNSQVLIKRFGQIWFQNIEEALGFM